MTAYQFSVYGNVRKAVVRPPTTNGVKYYDGSDSVIKSVKHWNCSAWQAGMLKHWNGSAWVRAGY